MADLDSLVAERMGCQVYHSLWLHVLETVQIPCILQWAADPRVRYKRCGRTMVPLNSVGIEFKNNFKAWPRILLSFDTLDLTLYHLTLPP